MNHTPSPVLTMFNPFKNGSAKTQEPAETESQDPVDLRMAERKDVFADILLKTSAGLKKTGIILDLSDCGARLRFVSADCMSEQVLVQVPRLRLKRVGRVRWKTRTDVGVEFID